jgi:membrane-associated phospholipid phosphatase
VRGVARALSVAGHPFATMAAFALAAGSRAGVARTAVLAAAAIVVPIAVLVAVQRRSGAWETVDASRPRERPVLYAVAGSAAAAVLAALVLRRDAGVAREIGGALVLVAGAFAVSRWVKASLHVAFAAFAAAASFRLGAPAAWGFATAAPAIAWSRLRLGRHAPVEIAAGAALGVVAGLLPAWR